MKALLLLGPLAAVLALGSCASSNISPSGFLDNFSQLGSGHDPANTVASYLDENADFSKYDSILLDPVTTIVDAVVVDALTVEQLAAYVDSALRTELGKDYKLVSSPGPATMRLRAALTDIIEGQPATLPVVRAYSSPRTRLSGELGAQEVAAFVSDVSFEAEILDSVSGRRLMATSDQRYGAKREAAPSTDWSEIEAFVREGAGRLRARIGAWR